MTLTCPGCGCANAALVNARPAMHRARRVVDLVIDALRFAVVARPVRPVGSARHRILSAWLSTSFSSAAPAT
jgi:hypothetical protein